MTTTVFGSSDDLIEFEGDFSAESNVYQFNDADKGALVLMSDGTVLEAKYGKHDRAIWSIEVVRRGPLLDRVEICVDEEATCPSDVIHFKDGIRWAYVATEWESAV